MGRLDCIEQVVFGEGGAAQPVKIEEGEREGREYVRREVGRPGMSADDYGTGLSARSGGRYF
jgi:hypothetical protein